MNLQIRPEATQAAPPAGEPDPFSPWPGFRALAGREIRRFLKVWAQTLGAPVVTTLLFLGVFVLALDTPGHRIGGTPFVQFLGAGLVMMALAQNAFANVSSSLLIAKMQGNIVDLLMAPLPPAALLGGLLAGSVARGLLVGGICLAVMWPLAHFPVPDPPLALLAALLAASVLGLLGLLAGLWAEKMDHLATVTNFLVTPLAFLSGTFYSVERLPEPLRRLAYADPLFWMIDAFRAGLTGHAEGRPWLGLLGLAAVALALWLLALGLLRRGWRLRA
ncbi:MAG: ABC transporter permease [Acetobacteraceae bacterium]|nr:ABC transporter permease [Acetobacteraceae bacterium]